MNLESKKRVVSFVDDVEYCYYEGYGGSSDWISPHESSLRRILETSVLEKPDTELGRVLRLISSWRRHDTSIVFGNLGRQPQLLDFYLDTCFDFRENVVLTCRWKLESPYQTANETDAADFSFLVEPPFGCTIRKPPRVRHLIVLTSHLNVLVVDPDKKYYFLHLSTFKSHGLPLSTEVEKEEEEEEEVVEEEEKRAIEPPVFHERTRELTKDRTTTTTTTTTFVLDVRRSKSANEAYLRILTGKEMIKERPFRIRMNERDRKIITSFASVTKNKMKELRDVAWIRNFYCGV